MPVSTQSKLNFTSKKNVPNQKAITHDIVVRASAPPSKSGEEQKALTAETKHEAEKQSKKEEGDEEKEEEEEEEEEEPKIEIVAGDSTQRPTIVKLDDEEQEEEALFQEELIEKPRLDLGLDKKLSDKAYEITHRQIQSYYKDIENSRICPAVHQEGLTEYEKILRHFDLSSQYGPCVGVSRFKRWERAERLGLGPPIEVLAVLLKAELGEGVEKPPKDWKLAPADVREDVGSIAYINQLIATHTE
ncbi:uncharacterized protein DFL_006193 [Arthrobotrys flagrans]|uniref:DNA polymerase delta subunit 4 n=1 Tax=Arthrobotrys flagrans TaxID=97331 RepID=A0A436ZZP6_ARTFL|nr:hypothetical protein DFL_006193 [Arthrobotrys flagrans]